MKSISRLAAVTAIFLSACSGNIRLGNGGSMATGSAGDKGAIGASSQLARCSSPVGTIAVKDEYSYDWWYGYGLRRSPIPLVRLMLQQSGCFKVVDRTAGLDSAKDEIGLGESGYLRKGSKIARGKFVEADYTLIPHITFTDSNAGGLAAGVLGYFGGGVFADLAGSLKFSEAEVLLAITDNRTTEQFAVAEGSASATDIGGGAFILARLGGGASGYTSTAEGKVIAAALMDGVNGLVQQVDGTRPNRS